MPLYEYTCKHCGISIEKLEQYSAPETQDCNTCGQSDTLQRQIARSSFALTGSSWYSDGYK